MGCPSFFPGALLTGGPLFLFLHVLPVIPKLFLVFPKIIGQEKGAGLTEGPAPFWGWLLGATGIWLMWDQPSWRKASNLHSWSHTPQPTHWVGSMTAFLSFSFQEMAGQPMRMHSLQPLHLSGSMR